MSDFGDVKIVKLSPEYAKEVAELHISGISTGFISSLGIDFVTVLYRAIEESEHSVCLMAQKDSKVVGFAAFTTDLSALYRSVICKSGCKFVFLLARKLFSLSTLKKIFETLLYPSRIKKMDLPGPEFLSMVIVEEERGKGLATELIKQGFAECAKQGVEELKIFAAVNIKPINKMYEKLGFELVGQMDSHDITSNVYVARTNHFDRK
jgi:ribosomal protein S18 acetylase RimI-like enzyme